MLADRLLAVEPWGQRRELRGGSKAAPPKSGVYSGLDQARHEYVLTVGCDMPFLNPALLAHMLRLPRDYDALLPRHGDGMVEPLHAVYSRACREPILRRLQAGQFWAISYLPDVRVRYVEEQELRRLDPDLRSFFNVNTPEQLREAIALARR